MYHIRNIIRNIKETYRLNTKGYTNYDVYELHHSHSHRMIKLLTELKDSHVGCPSDLFDNTIEDGNCHRWEAILQQMIDGFQAAIDIDDIDMDVDYYKKHGEWDYTEYNKLDKKFKKGMKLFTEYYRNLWD